MDEVITSAANATVKHVRALADRKYRRRAGAFVVEGLQPVWRAVTSGWAIETLVVAPELLTNEAACAMVQDQREHGIRVVAVSRDVFHRLSDRDGPAGLLAVVQGSLGPLAGLTPAGHGPVVSLRHVGNPGNVGTILRSADAAGAAALVLVGAGADPFAPAAVKASMGSVFAVPMAHAGGDDDIAGWAREGGRGLYAVTGGVAADIWTAPLDPEGVFLFGSEGGGLPEDLVARCDDAVAIPMQGTAESLNLATAVSVTLYELKRRRDVRIHP